MSFVLLTCILFFPVYGVCDSYTMEDLQALDKAGNYLEIIKHMDDIRPSQRNDAWKSIVHTAVLSTMQKQLQNGDASVAVNLAEQALDSDSSWLEDKKFIELRDQAVIKESTECFRNSYYSSDCAERLTGLVNKTPKDLDLAFKAGKLVRLQANASTAIPFFSLALKNGDNNGKCGDEDVFLAVQSGMGLPPEGAKQAMELGFSTCFKELKTFLLDDFYKSSGYALKNYCSALSEKKMLTDFQQAFCLDHQ